MIAFLDFEASSLSDDSYPIEVGWVFEDDREESWLIRPAEDWTDWAVAAEAVHHISRAQLLAEGAPHDLVARRVLEALGQHQVYASAPSWDGKWLSLLLRSAGLPRHALRLHDTDDAQMEAAVQALTGAVPDEGLAGQARQVIAAAQEAAGALPVRHRALDDARRELAIWRDVGMRARMVAGGGADERTRTSTPLGART